MPKIETGNRPPFTANFGPVEARKPLFLPPFGTFLGKGRVSDPSGISHFPRGRKSFKLRTIQVVSDKSHYVNYLCRIKYGGKGV